MGACAFGGAGDGQHVVHAHDQVGHDHGLDSAPELVRSADVAVGLVLMGGQQFHADPHQEHGADQLEVGHGQQGQGEGDQDDPQADGARGAVNDAQAALLGRQTPASQRDDDGVVAPEQDVNKDDLADSDPERGSGQCFHDGEGARPWLSVS